MRKGKGQATSFGERDGWAAPAKAGLSLRKRLCLRLRRPGALLPAREPRPGAALRFVRRGPQVAGLLRLVHVSGGKFTLLVTSGGERGTSNVAFCKWMVAAWGLVLFCFIACIRLCSVRGFWKRERKGVFCPREVWITGSHLSLGSPRGKGRRGQSGGRGRRAGSGGTGRGSGRPRGAEVASRGRPRGVSSAGPLRCAGPDGAGPAPPWCELLEASAQSQPPPARSGPGKDDLVRVQTGWHNIREKELSNFSWLQNI